MTTTNWVIDPAHSEIGFKVRHLMIANVSGNFNRFEVAAKTDGDDFSKAKIEARIDTASINTNNLQRDEHLRNSDFFEVDTYPQILFTSNAIEQSGDDELVIHGDLTMKGITKPVVFHAEYSGLTKDPWGNQRAGFVITGKINRAAFGLSFNSVLETGGVALGEEIKLNLEVQMVKQVAAVAA